VDLKTGELLEPRQEWLITKQANVAYDPSATCPKFEKFLLEIMKGRSELVSYLQRLIGYLLTGDCREQAFFIWHGVGANGKSTLLQLLQAMLNEYATTSRMETWTVQKRNAGGPSEDVARLHGVRMVCAVESEEDQRLAESLIKELTGQDKVAARRLYENSFEFVPQFKLILVCNHRPIVRGDDPAIWRRLRLLPFERTFAVEEQDKTLAEQLRAELPGILSWAVRGCLEWQRAGLDEPDVVKRATNQYRDDSDVLREFVTEMCDVSPAHRAHTTALYNAYKSWIEQRGHRFPMTMTAFSRKLQDRGFAKDLDKKTRVSLLKGLKLAVLTAQELEGRDDVAAQRTRQKEKVTGGQK
jgi:putative DNA primase/helicase